jgi:hypothetical protein
LDLTTEKIRAEIELQGILYENYFDKDFKNTEKLILDFLKNRLPIILNIKKMAIYDDIVDIEFNKLYYVFFESLKQLDDSNILSRIRVDSNLLINMPSNILVALNNIKIKTKAFEKQDLEEEDYIVGLLVLFPFLTNIYDGKDISTKEILKLNKEKINDLPKNSKDNKAKTIFKQYKDDVEKNKNKVDNLKKIDDEVGKKKIDLIRQGAIAIKTIYSDIWQSSFLKNSRNTHKNASGQKRNLDGYFIVGGERFRYAGDWSNASIGNVINCRCYIINN